VAALLRLLPGVLLLALLVLPQQALAADKAKLFATAEKGFGRLIIDFPARLDLPAYKLRSDNGVLSVEFATPADFSLPDIAAALPDYVSVARVDPDGKGIRFGLRTTLSINHMDAGEQLFIDLMPTTWQGLPPGLPAAVVANLAERAKQAALVAEQQRRAAEAKISHPAATVRIGRNPTFTRVEFTWNVDTEAKFAIDGKTGNLDFDWPVPIELDQLRVGLPTPLKSVDNRVSPAGSRVAFHMDGLVKPRFYAVSNRDFIVDIDTPSSVPANPNPVAEATAKAVAAAVAETSQPPRPWWLPPLPGPALAWAAPALAVSNSAPQGPITPQVATVGSTVRITFPFSQDTPAAVFRRGDAVWMLFDTLTGIKQPKFSEDLAALAKNFTIVPAGDMQVVRLDLSTDRLATLGSEGRAWVLSIGDMLLAPTAPIALRRQTDRQGLYEMTADLDRPGRVHQFADPLVGDTLTVVTAFPPARGIARDLDYVDFDALHSVQGLVIKPESDSLSVGINGKTAVISVPGGLTVSPPDAAASAIAGSDDAAPRDGFIDLAPLKEDNPIKFEARVDDLTAVASRADGQARDAARLDLARFYLANRFGFEAISVLGVMQAESKSADLKRDAQLMLAAADVVSARPADALAILDTKTFADDIDAQLWRSLAETDMGDFVRARHDAVAADSIIGTYPGWVRARFRLSGVRAAIETDDLAGAERLFHAIEFGHLDPDQMSEYQLLAGRLAEAEGRTDEALDTYGQVIAADIRPTRAEAVYRTILILDKTGKVDAAKAAKTLAAEAMLWRGDRLEADMDKLLAGLYFRSGQYRFGFETAKQAVAYFPSSPAMDALSTEAQQQFQDLYLNGEADRMKPIEALALYYDFRALTPPGASGDQMIRNLAERLVKVDLLSQAAELLKYQVENRLKGAAQAQIAAELAVIDIANRKPDEALRVLNGTALAELPPSLERQRRILQARALIDANRTDLALDLLSSVTGRDADQLRVEANWNARNYEKVGNLLEVMYAPEAAGGQVLSPTGRMDLVRAAVSYALAGDRIGVSRLRGKFADAMAKGAEWPMFDYVTSTIEAPTSPAFAKVLRAVADIDSLDAFLKSYREAYGKDAALTPAASGVAEGAPAGTAPPATAG
jgi:hypothetical protein